MAAMSLTPIQRLPFSRTANIGVSGITSERLLREFKRHLSKKKVGETKRKFAEADLVIIDVSRNDYWKNIRPTQTVNNIRRLVKYLSKQTSLNSKVPPLVVVTTPAPTTRGFQRPFIQEVTRLLLKLNSSKFPVHIRFDRLSTKYISEDGLHPTKQGYKKMGKMVLKYLNGKAQKYSARKAKDSDGDGVYDKAETLRFGTSPDLSDTDGDLASDGVELFTLGTDPLVVDQTP